MTISQTGQGIAAEATHSHGGSALPEAAGDSRLISVSGSAQAVKCPPGASVLDAFERSLRPLAIGGQPVVRVGCRRGGCGICKVRILEGLYRSAPMSRAHVSADDQGDGLVLSCCIFPETDLVIESVPVCPKSLERN